MTHNYFKRWVVTSNYFGTVFVEGMSNRKNKAEKIARTAAKYHPGVRVHDTSTQEGLNEIRKAV